MKVQRRVLGFFSGAVLFFTFLYLYPIQTQAPAGVEKAMTVAPEPQKVAEKEISFTVLEQGELAPGALDVSDTWLSFQNESSSS